jgi:TolA-binding protein
MQTLDNTDAPSGANSSRSSARHQDVHRPITRADDGNPLEALVQQLGQHVTQLDSDVTALKTTGAQQQQQLTQLQQQVAHTAVSTFTRWGSS